ncbi:ATP-dependent DNA helicase PIF1-like [Hydra vulgaris]|uniref:ATP-dependent DNA helicase n=1 Tax=Hydra vulgaris TaxID=6087 RepID=A0ABM4BZQ4_HYDVU
MSTLEKFDSSTEVVKKDFVDYAAIKEFVISYSDEYVRTLKELDIIREMNKITENDEKLLDLLNKHNEQKNVLNNDEILAMNTINQNKKMLVKIINMNSLVVENNQKYHLENETLNDDEISSVKFFKNNKKCYLCKNKKALQWLDEGINFFITGGAGCGKSYIVKEIAQSVQIYKTIHITASTGKAAHLLNGVTIHAFAGIENGVKSLDYYKRHMHPDINKTWLETDVLIVDEISMINAQTFDLLHLIACEMKQCYDKLFGGIQVIA